MVAKSRVCCDANLVVRLSHPLALAVAKLWRGWIADSKEVVAPPLFRYEVTNAIHRFANTVETDTCLYQFAVG